MASSQINNIMQVKCCFLCNASSASTITKPSDFLELLVISLSVTVLPAQLLHLPLPLQLRMSGRSKVLFSLLVLILANKKASGHRFEGVTWGSGSADRQQLPFGKLSAPESLVQRK